MDQDAASLEFVAVSTPGGSTMTLAPFSDPPTKKRKADASVPAAKTPKSSADGSWRKNLQLRGGFWGDARWYDLQLERRLPQAKEMLQQLVLALPPCGGKQVLDLCAGSGRASAALLEAYPSARLTLLDSSAERLAMAETRLDSETAQFVRREVTPGDETQLCEEPVDLVIACLAFNVLTERPAHYVQQEQEEETSVEMKYEQLFRATWCALRPGGHVLLGDHVGQLPLFEQLKALERAGFEDVDCAWRQDGSFVAGARKPME
jgi:SAM-dependent methyltransferase